MLCKKYAVYLWRIFYARGPMAELIHTYPHAHLLITADAVVLGFDGKALHVLLIERALDPFKGYWALPGDFMKSDETAEQCAMRALYEETGIAHVYLEQFHTFSASGRDPRGRVVAVAFLALIRKTDFKLMTGNGTAHFNWFELDELPPLAFDHHDIISMARTRMQEVLRNRPIAFKLLDKKFSIAELQRLYEAINGTSYDRRNFHKKMTSTGFLRDEGVSTESNHNRFPNLFSFDEAAFDEDLSMAPKGRNPFNV